jgi:hypothetical protein
MGHDDKRLQQLVASARQIPAPAADVVASAMKSIRAKETASASNLFFSIEAAVAFLAAVCVVIPAMESAAALLDPMIVLFSSVEAAFQ